LKFYSITEKWNNKKGGKSAYPLVVTQVKAKTEDEAESKLGKLFSLPKNNIISFQGIYTKKEMKRVMHGAKGLLKVYGDNENIIFQLIKNSHPKKGEMIWKLLDKKVLVEGSSKKGNLLGTFTSAELSAVLRSYRLLTS